MERSDIIEQQTYRTGAGTDLYVQAIYGERVVYCHIGQIVRLEASLGRFAAMVDLRSITDDATASAYRSKLKLLK